jgi:hypothetical protein
MASNETDYYKWRRREKAVEEGRPSLFQGNIAAFVSCNANWQ